MPLISMRQILDHAAENNYGVPAFNMNDMELVIADCQAPYCIETIEIGNLYKWIPSLETQTGMVKKIPSLVWTILFSTNHKG